MEVSSVYFRRLLATNASQIFPNAPRTATAAATSSTSASSATTPTSTTANTTDAGGTYQLLLGEMHKLTRSPQQAYKIAAALDTTDGEIYRDFDLSTFMDHFRLDAVAKTTLALACRSVSKQDVRTKGVFCLCSVCFISSSPHVVFCSHHLHSPLSSRANHSAQPTPSSPAITTTCLTSSQTPQLKNCLPLSSLSSLLAFSKTHRGNGMTRKRPASSTQSRQGITSCVSLSRMRSEPPSPSWIYYSRPTFLCA